MRLPEPYDGEVHFTVEPSHREPSATRVARSGFQVGALSILIGYLHPRLPWWAWGIICLLWVVSWIYP